MVYVLWCMEGPEENLLELVLPFHLYEGHPRSPDLYGKDFHLLSYLTGPSSPTSSGLRLQNKEMT